jgi:AraC-like DNA-binding protein/mannose-6-phosphate isomerase-like protein (cupin superfamily)
MVHATRVSVHTGPSHGASAEDLAAALLGTVEIASVVQCRAALVGTWSLEFVEDDCAVFHVVHAGSPWLRVTGDRVRELAPGDVVLVAPGRPHRIGRGTPGKPVWRGHVRGDVNDGCQTWDMGDAPDRSELVCGGFRFRDPASPLVVHLPSSVVVSSRRPDGRFLASVAELLSEEARRSAAGIVLRRLADVLFFSIVRAWIGGTDADLGTGGAWARVACDARMRAAIVAIHTQPTRGRSLVELAKHVGMSRSSFTDRFKVILGTSPGDYVTAVRMQRARALLRDTDASVAEVAATIGYRSEAAFSRAFKRHAGVPPSQFRYG